MARPYPSVLHGEPKPLLRGCGNRIRMRVRYAPIAAPCGSTLQPEAPMHRTSFAIAKRLPRTLDVLRARDAAGVKLLATP